MRSKVTQFIDTILLEAALDARVESGMVDVKNAEHLIVLAEHMVDNGLDAGMVASLINELVIRDGKYPDRQAYNKDGWLVTFPSAEYMQAAIKRGSHYKSDPTHGRGGMNLYYKKRGKQKRMTQQDPTQVQTDVPPTQPAAAPSSPPSIQQTPQQGSEDTPPEASTSTDSSELPKASGSADSAGVSQPSGEDSKDVKQSPTQDGTPELPPKSGTTTDNGSAPPSEPTSQPIDKPVVDNVAVTIEFAKSKGWSATPYGEWRNAVGETSAVVSLSGEVAPVKTNDREELKLFASKKNSNA